MNPNYILTPDDLEDVVDVFMDHEAFSFDVESTGENRDVPIQNTVNWLSMATRGVSVAIPFGHPNGNRLISKATRKKQPDGKFRPIPAVYSAPPPQMRPSEVFEIVRPLFFSDRVKIAHNATFDLVSVWKYFGELPPPRYADTIVMQWLLDENLKQKGLKELVKKYYKVDYDQENVGKCVEAHPFRRVAHYAFMDARYTWFLYERLLPRLERAGLTSVFELEMDILGVLCRMNKVGAPIDEQAMVALEERLADRLVDVEGRVYKAAGKEFNLNAPAQKAKVLYLPKSEGGQGLKPLKPTDGGRKKLEKGMQLEATDYSTDADSLEIHPNNPVVKELQEFQTVNRLLNGYVRAYLGDPDAKDKPCRIYDGRIHAEFVQYGTVTGRFSCREPNLQNIPRPDTDLGKEIRGLFIAPPGHKLVVADYGQIEMVLLAHYIGRGKLFTDLIAGEDPHTSTAAGVFGIALDQVTKDQRQAAKAINFAVVYGAGPAKVAAMAGVSEKEAKRFLELHQKTFPEIYRFKDAVIKECRRRKPPHIKTILGRKRRLPTIHAKDYGLRGYAERQAVNSLIQGSAADLIKLSMVRLDSTLPEDMHLSLTVHDELVTIVPEARTELGAQLVSEAMLGRDIAKLIKIPLKSDVKVVDRWSEAK